MTLGGEANNKGSEARLHKKSDTYLTKTKAKLVG